jgi:hypothetical protein
MGSLAERLDITGKNKSIVRTVMMENFFQRNIDRDGRKCYYKLSSN